MHNPKPSFYYQYEFISPNAIYAKIKEELRSYFDAGIIDDSLFPVWTKYTMDKLGRATYPIFPMILDIQNYEARLPEDFYAVREAWSCQEWSKDYQLPNASYQQTNTCSSLAIKLNSTNFGCDMCAECESPDIMKAVYKVTDTVLFHFKRNHLLSPGNVTARNNNGQHCHIDTACIDTYEIRGNKFTVLFPIGMVYMTYYSKEGDDDGQLIPDNFRVRDYLEAYLKQKCFEQIFNQTTDETWQQSEKKYGMYKQQADVAYIMAELEMKKEDIYKKQRRTEKTLNRYGRYNIR